MLAVCTKEIWLDFQDAYDSYLLGLTAVKLVHLWTTETLKKLAAHFYVLMDRKLRLKTTKTQSKYFIYNKN